jgi:mono/diheme cytochrome c family protein
MKRGSRIVLILLAAASVAAGAAVVFFVRHGISARDSPTRAEAVLARGLRHFAVPSAARNRTNPVPETADGLSDARSHFADHCASCHGNDGKGETEIGRNLYPRAPDMTHRETQALSDGELFFIIKNGVRLTGMPAWGKDTAEDDRASWQLVRFLRHLPSLTAEELEEMKKANPVSRAELDEQTEMEQFLEAEHGAPSPRQTATTGHGLPKMKRSPK